MSANEMTPIKNIYRQAINLESIFTKHISENGLVSGYRKNSWQLNDINKYPVKMGKRFEHTKWKIDK